VLRLLITPAAVLTTSAAERRFGPAAGGHIVALPLTTGPFLLLLGLKSGPAMAAHAAVGVVVGELSVMAFCACYGLLTHRRDAPVALGWSLAAALGCALLAALGHHVAIWLAALLVAGTCLGFAALQPAPAGRDTPARTARAWDVPLRVGLTTAIVATPLELSAVLGPILAGTLATLPVILSVMVPATHLRDGASAATAVARGTLVALPATTAEVCMVGLVLVPLGPVATATLGLAALIDRLRHERRDPVPRSADGTNSHRAAAGTRRDLAKNVYRSPDSADGRPVREADHPDR
jgi:hypothetical protein